MTWTMLISRILSGNLYLDPGSGSFLLQLLIAGALGAALAVKIYWRKIMSFFKKDSAQPAPISTTEETKSPTDEK